MAGDPRDKTAYGFAVASLGFALAVLIAGICWVATEHRDLGGLWVALVTLGGLLVGVLIPWQPSRSDLYEDDSPTCFSRLATNTLLLLFAGLTFVGAVLLASFKPEWSLLCCGVGALLLGLLIPSPAAGD
jgi:hypothetical protein